MNFHKDMDDNSAKDENSIKVGPISKCKGENGNFEDVTRLGIMWE